MHKKTQHTVRLLNSKSDWKVVSLNPVRAKAPLTSAEYIHVNITSS